MESLAAAWLVTSHKRAQGPDVDGMATWEAYLCRSNASMHMG